MAIEAQLADGRILEFPDGTDPAVIQSTVKRLVTGSKAAPKPTQAAEPVGYDFGAAMAADIAPVETPEKKVYTGSVFDTLQNYPALRNMHELHRKNNLEELRGKLH